MKKIVLLLISSIFFFACNEEVKPLEFETSVIDNSYKADIEVAFDKAKATSDIAKKINTSITSEILKSIPNSETHKTIEDALKAFDTDYTDFKSKFPESEQRWTLAIETEVLYKTESIITMGLSTYSDTGGAHGNDSIHFLNFNPETGNRYTNEELFSDLEGFKKLAETYFLDHMKNEGSDISEFFFGKPFQLPENIGFNEEGIILLYNVYEIASYNQGYTEFVIPIEHVKQFLKSN
ncbi:RsiV family protein [Winogradskyella haliclonae]|uniref:DUF3298/DUF4163 domain-containing protein n=1 Tax=Winogradskyella haliclonae TaxID=2048558 RepID=A0ABQ2BXF9_9FLAO|nr:DUF3298 and DUF4163 domain-containing protein [Winogradskyella haliclonae]GGI56467.1 hypothetical protein GCM10011444_07760 [Winogradskyella haliclonae]